MKKRRTRLGTCFVICLVSTLTMLGNCSAWRAADDDYSLGRQALRTGDYAGAIQRFESALTGKINLEGSQAGLLQALRETGQYREGIRRAGEFISSRNKSAILYLERGRSLSEIGKYSDAEKDLRQSLAYSAGSSAVRLSAFRELGDLLEETGRRKEAAVFWDNILNEYQAGRVKGSRPLADAAMAAWRRGYVYDARDIFIDATEPQTGEVSPESLADFGYLFLEKYRVGTAIDVFRDCLKINKSYPPALLGIALAKKYDNNMEVESYSRAALKVNPNLTGALNALAEIAIDEESYDAALQQIDRALEVNPGDLDSLSLKAFCLYARGDKADFEKIEKQVFGINPSFGEFYYVLADNLASRRKYQEAVDWSRKAIALDPELWPAYVTLGMNLTRVGDLEGGRKAIQQAFDGDGFNVWADNWLKLFQQMDQFARIQNGHFVFLMSKEDEPAFSSYAPELSEEVYTKLSERYGFKPDGPLQVEIFPDKGGFAVRTLGLPGLEGALGVCFGKVVALNSPIAREPGSFNWGATLWHEFTHVITLQMTNYNIPRWYSEGLSTYEEHRARPGWGDPLTLAFIRAFKTGKLMKASELNSGFVRPKSPEQIIFAYYQAGLVCQMIEERYGFEKIRQSLLLFAQNKPAEEVFRQTLGWNMDQMDAEYAKYLDLHFKDVASRLRLGSDKGPGVEATGEPDKDTLARRVEKDPDDFLAQLQLGILLRKAGDNSQAEIHLKKAQQLFPQYVEPGNSYELLGKMYLEMKREEDALAQFKAWTQADGIATEPLLKAAGIYAARKDWNSVVSMLKLSVFIDPYNQQVQKDLGEAALSSGQWRAAIAAFRTLVGLDRTDEARARYDLARAQLAAGNRQEAKREVIRSLEIAPRYGKAQELLLKIQGGQNAN